MKQEEESKSPRASDNVEMIEEQSTGVCGREALLEALGLELYQSKNHSIFENSLDQVPVLDDENRSLEHELEKMMAEEKEPEFEIAIEEHLEP